MVTEFQPYKGPRPYERDDLAPFFGRNREADELVSLIVSSWELLFYAQSGAGKTSLLNAKVIPLLVEEEGFEVLPLARVQGVLPKGIEPDEIQNIYVYNTLMSWANDEDNPRRLAQMSLTEFLKERKHPFDKEGQPLARALIFDQFEELFALYQDRWRDRKGFFEQMRDALKDDHHLLRVVFAIREDYLAHLDPYAPLLPEKLRTRFRMELLRRDAALSAITGPIRKTSRSFAKGVAEKLVEDLLKTRVETVTGETTEITGEFVEPVQLQVVCENLWQELPPEDTEITEQHLLTFGGVDRPLSRFYERVISKAAMPETGIHENELRQWCEKWLITSTGTRGIVHRGPQSTEGIPNSVLDILEAWHLIRSEWRSGARWYELTHDRFIGPIRASNERWNKQREEKANVALLTLRQAEQSIAMQKYDQALDYSRQVYSISEEIGDQATIVLALHYSGKAYEGQKQYIEALVAYIEALEIGRKTSYWQEVALLLETIGALFIQMKRYEQVVLYSTEYIDLWPSNPLGYIMRASAYWYLGRVEEAIADLTRAIELDPKNADAYVTRGYTYIYLNEGRHKYDRAFQDFDRAFELNPKDARAYFRRGVSKIVVRPHLHGENEQKQRGDP